MDGICHRYASSLQHLFVQLFLLQRVQLILQLHFINRLAKWLRIDGVDNLVVECVLVAQFVPVTCKISQVEPNIYLPHEEGWET